MDELLIQRLILLATEITTLSNQAENLISLNDDSVHDAEMIIAKLENFLTRLNTDLNNYFRLVNVPLADEINEISEIQLKAEENLTELTVRFKSFTKNKINRRNTQEANAPTTTTSCRLPKLNLPEFDGEVLQWHQFWDQFQSNIHNRDIPEVDKLLFLKISIKGEAKKTIDGLETTNKNYKIAIDSLLDRYGKNSHLIDAHYSALSKVTAKDTTIDSCRKTFNEIEKHLRVLESLGEDVNHNHLRHLIYAKFPEDIIYELKLKTKDDSIHVIRKQLEIIISAREDANRITLRSDSKEIKNYTIETLHVTQGNQRNNNYRRQNIIPKRRFGQNNNIALKTKGESHNLRKRRFDQTEERNEQMRRSTSKGNRKQNGAIDKKRRRLSCLFCKGNHFNDQCGKYKTIKDRIAQLKGRCFGCFQTGHLIKECKKRSKCVHCEKHGQHNRALCPTKFPSKTETTTLSTVNEKGVTVLQTAVVTARNRKKDSSQISCRILFDSGSQRSYVTRRIAQKLKLPIEVEETLSVYTFGSRSPQEFESPVVTLELETKSKNNKTIYANVVPTITQGVTYVKLPNSWKGKEELADDGSLNNQVDILIGNDYYHSLLRTGKVQIEQNLYLVESEFGWILSGKIPDGKNDVNQMSVVTYFQTEIDFKLNKPDTPLDQGSVAFLWELETIGITDSPKITKEEEAITKFNETTKLIDNRYHVSWPWNEYPPTLTPNYGLAYGRLVNLIKRLDTETLKSYDNTLKEQISKGIVEEVLDIRKVEHPVHYLPHHCVAQKGKPIRIVYDASAKIKGNKSLNECLYCGPLMLEDLTGLIIRFRSHNIAISADVEKAFLQIALHKQDRDVTRFLWLKDINNPPNVDNIICMRFCRVPFGVISSPFILNATIKDHLSKGNEKLRQISQDIYVDNLVTGVQEEDEALHLYKETKEAFREISMNLRDWSSNSKHFMNKISDASQEKIVKILGLDWHLENDSLHIRFKIDTNANCKRDVLKVIASVYDPCGFVVPHVLAAKLFLQDLWKIKIKWDAKLSKDMHDKWSEITKELEDIRQISLPRCYIKNIDTKDYNLHCFTDASLQAYAAVVYVTHGNMRSFVIGKSRLVPVKDQQHLKIPRLELLAVMIGCRLIRLVLKTFNMNIQHQTLWTDSQIVIGWYKSQKLLPPFVAKRIEEIKRNKELIIKYVPSELNPADVATRPTSSAEDKERWLMGPQFLSETTNKTLSVQYLTQTFLSSMREDLPNTSQDNNDNAMILDSPTENNVETQNNNNIKDKESYSITQEIKELQAKHFTQEVTEKETDLSRNLKLFKDTDGVLRCKGRLQNADLSFDQRYPILIPRECDFTINLIKKIHCENYHVGVNHTLSIIRKSYWIPKGRPLVSKILKDCYRCVKHGGGPFKAPPTPALPAVRVRYSEPFNFTGIDYMGPVLVKNGHKRWICLFTCLAVRAIHLELVQDLTAEEGLLALRRIIATRGKPKLITSDNATHFTLLSEILSKQYCADNNIKWKFIPQLAPWFGGYYERLIGIVKNCMKRTLAKHILSDTQLATVIKEIEAVTNTRPLTCVDAELDIILKPADFLTTGKCIIMEESPEISIEKGTNIKIDLIKSWKRGIIILQEFKEMFKNRYLPSLRERYNHSKREPRVTSKLFPIVDQIVQIKGDNKNRETWKVGKIISLDKGSDGLSRVAIVRVGDKEFTRSITHLYPLEVPGTEKETNLRFEENNITREPSPSIFIEQENEDTDQQMIIPVNTYDKNNLRADHVHETVQDSISHQSLESEEEKLSIRTKDLERLEPRERRERVDDENEEKQETRVKRVAATKALQKIREWTSNLLCLF